MKDPCWNTDVEVWVVVVGHPDVEGYYHQAFDTQEAAELGAPFLVWEVERDEGPGAYVVDIWDMTIWTK